MKDTFEERIKKARKADEKFRKQVLKKLDVLVNLNAIIYLLKSGYKY